MRVLLELRSLLVIILHLLIVRHISIDYYRILIEKAISSHADIVEEELSNMDLERSYSKLE